METLLFHEMIDAVYIVASHSWRDVIRQDMEALLSEGSEEREHLISKFRGFCDPGDNRQLSIYNALCDMSEFAYEEDVVLVQDAVRPLTSKGTITDALTRIVGHEGALPVLPMKDTVYSSDSGRSISSLLDRDKIFAGQAPEAYRYGKYKKANEELLPDKILSINGAAEPAVMFGMDVVMFPGDEGNFKITTAEDLKRYQEIIDKG